MTQVIKDAVNATVAKINAAGEALRAIKKPSPELVTAIATFNSVVATSNASAQVVGESLKAIDSAQAAILGTLTELQTELGVE